MAFQQSWNLRLMPCQFGRHRILLHAFSGRRRVGDVQFFLEQFAPRQEGYVLHVVSMDIINDPVLGDAMNEQTRQFWVQAVRMRHVVAFLGGPPCESWSYARGKHVEADLGEDRCGPRILRDVDQLWGFSSVSLRELSQLITGNSLLCFSLLIIVEIILIDGFAVLEHPAEPLQDRTAASIWRLAVIRALAALQNVQILRFAQGLMGSFSAKPTNLLVVNLPDLILTLHAHRVRTELPKTVSIGKDQQGRWRTTTLKEYLPALCRSLATEFDRALHNTPVDPCSEEPTPVELAQYTAMVVQDYGSVIGDDYARRGAPGVWRNSKRPCMAAAKASECQLQKIYSYIYNIT